MANNNEEIEEFRKLLNNILEQLTTTKHTYANDDTVKGNLLHFGVMLSQLNHLLQQLLVMIEGKSSTKADELSVRRNFIEGDIRLRINLLPHIVPDYARDFAQQVATLLINTLTNENSSKNKHA